MNTKIKGFEKVTGKEDTRLPERSTEHSAGYDFFAREDIKVLEQNDVDAVLIGETLMRSNDRVKMIKELKYDKN